MGEDEFWNSTPRYFAARQRGFADARTERHELARTHAFLTVLPHLKKGSLKKPGDLWPLPHDEAPAQAALPAKPAEIDFANDPDFAMLRDMIAQQNAPTT